MKALILLITFSLTFSIFSDNKLTEAEKADGWQLLFDGKSMDKWKGYKTDSINPIWQVKDGAIFVEGKGGGENKGDIITKQSFKNFEFKVEWKMAERGNSGIFILADEKEDRIYFKAPEIQVIANDPSKVTKRTRNLAGSLYDMVSAPVESQKKVGEWNKVRIRLKDKHLQIWQNGVKSVDIVIDSPKWNELIQKSKFKKWPGFAKNVDIGGSLGLQDHGCEVYFKNLKVKSLD